MFKSKEENKTFLKRLEEYKKEAVSLIVSFKGNNKPLVGKLVNFGKDYLEVLNGELLVSVPLWSIQAVGASLLPLVPNFSGLQDPHHEKTPPPAMDPAPEYGRMSIDQIEKMLRSLK